LAFKNQRKAYFSQIENAENEGLEPEDYNYKTLRLIENSYDDIADSTLMATIFY
jgi:hypothetical protein